MLPSEKIFRELKQTRLYQKTAYSSLVNRLHYHYGTKARLLWLNIEFTSRCNLKCEMCALDRSQPRGSMDEDLFKKLLNEINTSDRLKVDNISLWLGGETLLHPQFARMLEVLSSKRKEGKNFPQVTLLTNATLLYGKTADAIINTDAIDCILFSVDGGTKESFEALRRGAKWEEIIGNIRVFLSKNRKAGKHIKTGLVSIIDSSIECSSEFLELKKDVDSYLPRTLHNWDGSMELAVAIKRSSQKRGLCHALMRQMAVHWDGRVSPCCIDLNTRGALGDLRNQTLYEIYHSNQRRSMIHKMLRGLRKEIVLCKNCDL